MLGTATGLIYLYLEVAQRIHSIACEWTILPNSLRNQRSCVNGMNRGGGIGISQCAI